MYRFLVLQIVRTKSTILLLMSFVMLALVGCKTANNSPVDDWFRPPTLLSVPIEFDTTNIA